MIVNDLNNNLGISFNISKSSIMNSNSYFFFSVEKYDVQKMYFGKIDKAIKQFESCGTRSRGRLLITFNGYDDNPLEIYEIEEIRRYVKALFERHNNLFYFLSNFIMNNGNILACLLDGVKEKSNEISTTIKMNKAHPLCSKVQIGFLKYADKIQDISYESIQLLESLGFLNEEVTQILLILAEIDDFNKNLPDKTWI